MLRVLATVFAGLAGLAFGSFLNVCLSRWPAGESVVAPRSHCRACGRTLPWWENIPVLSWLALRGRCRTCHVAISWRYPLVELAVGALWASAAWRPFTALPFLTTERALGMMAFYWILVALAVLDAEHLWLPDLITLPAIVLGIGWRFGLIAVTHRALSFPPYDWNDAKDAGEYLLAILAAAGLVLLIRWIYWLVRRREGIGLGDAKLMALLAAWLGLPGALLAFVLGVVLGALVALVLLAVPRRGSEPWALAKLPLGTFLCIGGIVSALWGPAILDAYLRYSGLQ